MDNRTTLLSKTAYTIFKRTNRPDALEQSQNLAIELVANLNAAVLKYGIDDEFDLIEAIALDIIKNWK